MMKFKFQSFVDINTSASSMQVIQWSVGGADVINRCRHLFGAYKYFKLGRISVKMIPASTLPVDPLGLSYGDSDPQTVDPRDQMNPGLVRITNGEDIFTDVSSLNDNQQMQVYNAMMLDPRWSKFMLQSGFYRSAIPLYWQIGQLSQDRYPGATCNVPNINNSYVDGQYVSQPTTSSEGAVRGAVTYFNNRLSGADGSISGVGSNTVLGSSARGFFQTGHRGRLGFLPTDYFQDIIVNNSGSKTVHEFGMNSVPTVKCITCVLPKAYKTIYYYRVFITQEVIFSGLRSAPMVMGDGANGYGIDQFIMGNIVSVRPGRGWVNPAFDNNMNNGEDLP